MTNLYRIIKKNRGHPKLRRRDTLMRELEGKDHFTGEDLTKIFSYKGIAQTHHNRFIEKYTNRAFTAEDLETAIASLKKLNGVGMVMASTILSLQNPYKYAELSHGVWEKLQDEYGLEGSRKDHRSDYGIGEYETYLSLLKKLGDEYGMKLTDVEFVVSLLDEDFQE